MALRARNILVAFVNVLLLEKYLIYYNIVISEGNSLACFEIKSKLFSGWFKFEFSEVCFLGTPL